MSDIRSHSAALKALYAENDLSSESLIRQKPYLEAFTIELNRRLRSSYEATEVAAELERLRKDKVHSGGLPKLGRSYGGPKFGR